MKQSDINQWIGAAQKFVNAGRLPRLCIVGPSGAGKTYLAETIANSVGANILTVNGGDLKQNGHARLFSAINDALNQNSPFKVLFIDEAQELPKNIQTLLLTVIQDKRVMSPEGKTYNIAPMDNKGDRNPNLFAVWFGTTDEDKLLLPLVGRELRIYMPIPDVEEKVAYIVRNFPNLNDKEINELTATAFNYRDLASIKELYEVVGSLQAAFDLLGVRDGLFPDERQYMECLVANKDRPLSRNQLASMLSITPTALERVEFRLIKRGALTITSKGRQLADNLRRSKGLVPA